MTNFKILKPRIPENLELLEIHNHEIEDEDFFKEGIISDCTIKHQKADRVIFENIEFRKVVFYEGTFTNLELTDVKFFNCDLSNLDLEGAIIHRVEFLDFGTPHS